MFLPHFDVICDLLLNKRTATGNLFVKQSVSSVANQRKSFVIERQQIYTKTRQKRGTCFLFLKQKHKWKFVRTRNPVGTRVVGECFQSFFETVLPNFHECFYNSIETQRKCFLFLLETPRRKKGKQLVYFDPQNANSLCTHHHYVNSSCQFCFYFWFSVSRQIKTV